MINFVKLFCIRLYWTPVYFYLFVFSFIIFNLSFLHLPLFEGMYGEQKSQDSGMTLVTKTHNKPSISAKVVCIVTKLFLHNLKFKHDLSNFGQGNHKATVLVHIRYIRNSKLGMNWTNYKATAIKNIWTIFSSPFLQTIFTCVVGTVNLFKDWDVVIDKMLETDR